MTTDIEKRGAPRHGATVKMPTTYGAIVGVNHLRQQFIDGTIADIAAAGGRARPVMVNLEA